MPLHRVLLVSLLVGNVFLRYFTNYINALPRVLNIWDLFITLALWLVALANSRDACFLRERAKLLKGLLAFNCICIVGSLLNAKHVFGEAVLSQLLMWNEPIILFLAVVSAPISPRDIERYFRLLMVLVWIQIVIGVLQVPTYLRTGASESIVGTFYGNAEQYQFFIMIGVFYLLAQMAENAGKQVVKIIAAGIILVLVILIDNKASWLTAGICLWFIMTKLPIGHIQWKRYLLVVGFLGMGYVVAKATSGTAIAKYGGLMEAIRTGNVLNLGKVKALRDVLTSYTMYPEMIVVGSGLGTFYSRAAYQYFPNYWYGLFDKRYANYAVASGSGEGSLAGASSSMAGVISKVSGIEPFFKRFAEDSKIYSVGSGTADNPTSSYISLLGETGIVGTVLYLGLWLIPILKVRKQFVNASAGGQDLKWLTITVAAVIYICFMGCYHYYMESGRVNTIVWSMMALMIRQEYLRKESGLVEA